jgi:oxygen-independent coproporphyrinogen-3 oxidase
LRNCGVYVHFPWCLAKCPYCDFVSYGKAAGEIDHRGYADAVLRELDSRGEPMAHRKIESVFFGGGTPSLWEARELGRVLSAILALTRGSGLRAPGFRPESAFPGACSPEPGADRAIEVTVECNPTSIDEDRARALVDAGVNRLSIGVQSLNDDRLRFLGRLHDPRGAIEALRGALRAKVPRISADIIFGLPGQTPKEACDEVVALADLGLEHLSCYQLTIEPGTRFGELAKRGRLPLADDGAVAESFLAIDDLLSARGFVHYEISNYARPGQEARHNLGYWRGDEYLGLGCAAYGFLRNERRPRRNESENENESESETACGLRYRNDVAPQRYAAGAPCSEEPLDAAALMRERIMLGLRTRDGVDLDEAETSLGAPGWTASRQRAASWLSERGRIVRDGTRGSRVRVPREAWLWTDDTAARLF